MKGITYQLSRPHARTLIPEVLACSACGNIHPEDIVSRTVDFADAVDAMTEPDVKIVFVQGTV